MRSSLKALAFIVPLLAAGASTAQPDERCSGTLCDFYYGGAPAKEPAPSAKPAAPTPIMVPQGGLMGFFRSGTASNTAPSDANGTPQSSMTSRVHVGGGGVAGLVRGETPERCSGTICDIYYGGSPPEKPEQPTAAAAPSEATADAAIADTADEEPRARRRSRVEYVEREEKPGCAPNPQDPWRCYRK